MFKTVIVIIFVLIIITLFVGLYFLLKDQSRSRRTVQSLALRVSLAMLLLIIILLGFYTGELKLRTPFPLMPPSQQIDKQE